ncbi:hypothetical protein MRB53_034465 [Persea americana]|uniref:Uncharacterized protein n=1 Tax=Persea americana TaxID=3435 RepID=A0ACC2K258_PERAE|nr:hypothetical protein MRB53_034465 [Persea americana]
MRTKKRKSQLEYPFHLVNERRREDGVSIISSTPLLSVGMKNIALLLLLFAHFHLSVHTVISGPNDAAEKEPMARAAGRFASSGGHGAHGGGHAGHGHGGGNEGSHGSGHRDNDPTWWRQYHSGYPNNHSKASSSRSFARLVIGAGGLALIFLNY